MKVNSSLIHSGLVTGTLLTTAEVLDVYFRMGASGCALILGVYGIWKTFFKKSKSD